MNTASIVVCRRDYHGHVGQHLAQFGYEVDAITIWHFYVNDDQIGLDAGDLVYCSFERARLADNFKRISGKEQSNQCARRINVVDNEN